MVAVCLSFFQKRETSVTSTKHHPTKYIPKNPRQIFSIGPRWGKIRNCWSLWKSTPWRKLKLVPMLCMRTISLPCVAWKCLIGDSAGVLVEGEERNYCLFEFVYWVCWCVCLLFIYSLTFQFLELLHPYTWYSPFKGTMNLFTLPCETQTSCDHSHNAEVLQVFGQSAPPKTQNCRILLEYIKYKKQHSNVPRIVFPCFFRYFIFISIQNHPTKDLKQIHVLFISHTRKQLRSIDYPQSWRLRSGDHDQHDGDGDPSSLC